MITLEEWKGNCESRKYDKVYLVYVDYFGDENIHIAELPVEACYFALDFLGKGHLFAHGNTTSLDNVFFSKEEAKKHATFDNYPLRKE